MDYSSFMVSIKICFKCSLVGRFCLLKLNFICKKLSFKKGKKCLWKPIQLQKVAVAVWYLSSGTDFKHSLKLFGKPKSSVYNLCLLCFPKSWLSHLFMWQEMYLLSHYFPSACIPDHPQMRNLYASSVCSCCAFTSLFRAVHLWVDHPSRFSNKKWTRLIFQILTEVTIPTRSGTLNQGDLAIFSYIC